MSYTKSNTNQHGNCELKEEEVIKALECCENTKESTCKHCCFYRDSQCVANMAKNALDLINRQKAEIERLQKNLEEAHIDIKEHFATFKMEQAEEFKRAKSEAIKEFAERLNARISKDIDEQGMFPLPYTKKAYDTVRIFIDNLVKMAGD